MADISSENLFTRSARGFMNQLGEFVHVSAIYLGIAVLVTLVLSLTVPSLRRQSQQMHAALVATLRPDALQGGMMGSIAQANDDMLADSLEPEPLPSLADSPQPRPGPPPAGSQVATISKIPPVPPPVATPLKPPLKVDLASTPDFGHVLGVSADNLSIPNVSKAQVQALRSYIARKYQIAYNAAGVLIKTAFTVGREQNLDPQLLLAVIAIESRYNPFAASHVGAQGLMQVMADVHKDKFARFGGGSAAALNPIANIRVGSQILQDCIKRRGSVEGGLACYVGSTGPTDGGYGAKVLAERRRIALASGIPVGKK